MGAARLPALDGFRGIFVSLVLLYHFGVEALVGGWVGINHFFVFSGYLITRILISERARYGAIDVVAFYRRRAERLLPALLVLCAAVLAHAVLLATPGERHRTAGDVLASLFFVQNWRLIERGDSYFDMFGDPSPLRHLWTLGVEEQFYLFIPLLIIVVFGLVRSRWGRFAVVMGLLALSIAWTTYLANGENPDFGRLYFGTDTRAQALLAGVAGAVLFGRRDDGQLPARPASSVVLALGWVGTAISLLAFVVVSADSAWLFTHGGMAFFTLGAVLMGLMATDTRSIFLNRLVSWPPLVLLGQMTYGLYIYHWPIRLWVGPHLDGLPMVLSVAILFAITVAVSLLSFRYLEIPVLMHGVRGLLPRLPRRRELTVALGSTTAVALAAWYVFASNPAATDPLGGTAAPPRAATSTTVPPLVDGQAEYVPGRPAVVGIFGDSVAEFLGVAFPANAFPDARIVNVATAGCDLVDAPSQALQVLAPGDAGKCADIKRDWDTRLEAEGADALVIAASPLLAVPHVVDGEYRGLEDPAYQRLITAKLDEMVQRAKAAGVDEVAVLNVPCRTIDLDTVPAVVRLYTSSHPDMLREYKDPTTINRLIAEWATGKDVSVLDLYGTVCGDPKVETVGGGPLFADHLHFSEEASPALWSWILGGLSEAAAGADGA